MGILLFSRYFETGTAFHALILFHYEVSFLELRHLLMNLPKTTFFHLYFLIILLSVLSMVVYPVLGARWMVSRRVLGLEHRPHLRGIAAQPELWQEFSAMVLAIVSSSHSGGLSFSNLVKRYQGNDIIIIARFCRFFRYFLYLLKIDLRYKHHIYFYRSILLHSPSLHLELFLDKEFAPSTPL